MPWRTFVGGIHARSASYPVGTLPTSDKNRSWRGSPPVDDRSTRRGKRIRSFGHLKPWRYAMSHGTNTDRKMLLTTLAGHFAWRAEAPPRKAASPKAQRARRWVI